MLFWSFCLLTFIQIVAGLTISTLVQDFIDDTGANVQQREQVYLPLGRKCQTVPDQTWVLVRQGGFQPGSPAILGVGLLAP